MLVAVLVFELDQFKLVVDSFGHDISDQLLVEAGRVLARAVRPADTVARLSGDAFAVCCENLRDEGDVLATAERLAERMREQMVADGHEFRVTASIGIALGLGGTGVTPDSLIRDADVAVSRAKQLGVKLAIDDFGTGYSSLTYLRRFPIDALKVDRSFVNGVSENVKDATIVAAVVALAHAFGIPAIAEGVETPSQAAQLTDLGCDFAQGYLWGKPQPADQFTVP